MGLLRIILAISIIIGHTSSLFGLFVPSIVAVEAFFVISGFVIAYVLEEKYRGKKHSYRLFITNRLLKIYPAYWIILSLSALFSSIQFYLTSHFPFVFQFPYNYLAPFMGYVSRMNLFTKIYFFFVNLFVLGQDTTMFFGLNVKSGSLFPTSSFWKFEPQLHFFVLIPVAWVVALEMYFYFIA